MQQNTLFQRDGPIAGVDEAGRGPLAGPVVAAAVILAPRQDVTSYTDSKQLSAPVRERLADDIRVHSLAWSVAFASRAEIDALNILQATLLAMRRAVEALAIRPAFVRVDGNRLPDLHFGKRRLDGEAVVGGDAVDPAISAASILAKTERDRYMCAMDSVYPGYGFARHKGYGTALHRQRLAELGPSDLHRRSFEPLKSAS
ncbi:MAG: ribonuclease HII [Woeseiaceae bacterium]|nr:ribonuclease HII [Woeseiaceae bacterium]